MPQPTDSLRPQDRLVASRRALVQHMTHGEAPASGARSHADAENAEPDGRAEPQSGTTWQSIRRAANVWWNHHPAHLALDLAKPALQTYARREPVKLLLVSAGAGAAIALIRPWRLASLTGVLLAAVKSSGMPGAVLSLLSTYPQSKAPPQDPS